MITKHGGSLYEKREATFSDDMQHRYTLRIVWNKTLPILPVVGLNPSTADEMKNDPTIGKLCQFARAWGYGGILMLNLFSLRTPDPKVMQRNPQPNDEAEGCNRYVDLADQILCATFPDPIALAAWGSGGLWKSRGAGFTAICRYRHIDLVCLRKNPDGTPTHPLARGKNFIPLTAKPELYN